MDSYIAIVIVYNRNCSHIVVAIVRVVLIVRFIFTHQSRNHGYNCCYKRSQCNKSTSNSLL